MKPLYALIPLFLVACGSMPPGAKKAQRLLKAGDFAGAEKVADAELARFPKDPSLWRIKIQAGMLAGDAAGAVDDYGRWRGIRGAHDRDILETMAKTTLWQALRVPSSAVKTEAIQNIERLEVEALAQDVADRIADEDDAVAAAAAVALLRAHPQAPYIATQLLSSDDPRARAIAVEGIGRKIGAAARDDLVPMLGDSDPTVRRTAAFAIGAMETDEDTAALARVARDDADGAVRAAALRGLGRGTRSGVADAARAALADDYLGARLAAVHLLAEEHLTDELATLAAGGDAFVAIRAAVAIAGDRGAEAAAAVSRHLGADEWSVRVAALGALARTMDAATAIERARAALADPSVSVRIAAARALIALDSPDGAVEGLVAALSDDLDSPRIQAAIELARIGDARGTAALAELARSANADTRRSGVRSHVHIGEVTDSLIAALSDEAPLIRVAAAAAILHLVD